jgi:hypothetical protein
VPEFGMNPYYGKNYELRITNYEFQVRGNFQKTDNIKLKLPAAVAQSPKLKARSLSCRPCSKIGFNKCPKGHFKCMEWQDVEAIAKQAEIFLNPK